MGDDVVEGSVVLNAEAGKIYFKVKNADGMPLATSTPFLTVCRLEAALQTLASAAVNDWKYVTGPCESLIKVGRRRVPLRENLSLEAVSAVIQTATTARIVDERPASRRRYDLSGLRCDLTR